MKTPTTNNKSECKCPRGLCCFGKSSTEKCKCPSHLPQNTKGEHVPNMQHTCNNVTHGDSLRKQEEKHVCCDGECNHDDCCGKIEANCPKVATSEKECDCPIEENKKFLEGFAYKPPDSRPLS